MNAAQFADFWRIQGYRVIRTSSCYWYAPSPLVFMSIPYHRTVSPSPAELGHVLLGRLSLAARFLHPNGNNGGLLVCSDRNYDFHSLHKKARNQTRRGLENCKIEQLDFGYLAEHGSGLNEETFQRQGRDRRTLSRQQWRRYCGAASRITDFEAWGAFVRGRLAAFMVTALIEDHFSILHQSSATSLLEYYPNNALTFNVTNLKLSLPKVTCVSYGVKSLDCAAGVEHFKFQMGFSLRSTGQRVAFNPLFRPFLSSVGYKLITWMAQKHPDRDLWRKASMVLQQDGTHVNAY